MGCFEGMKAYAGVEDGALRLFRPDLNMRRLHRSARRLQLADFDPQVRRRCGAVWCGGGAMCVALLWECAWRWGEGQWLQNGAEGGLCSPC